MKKWKQCVRVLVLSLLILVAAALPVSAASKIKVAAPNNFRIVSIGDLYVNLRWTKASGISGYVLYEYDTATKKYKQVAKISKSSYTYTVRKLTEGKTYKYILRAYKKKNGKTVYSSPSRAVEFKARSMSDDIMTIRRPRYTVTTKKKVTVLNKTTKKKVTLAKGTKLTVTAKTGSTVNGYLKNGDSITIKRSYLKYTGLDSSSKKDYSKKLKEEFVNLKGYASKTNWLIWVSEMTFKVNVYKGSRGKWKLQESFPCCIGKWSTRTASGVKKILSKSGPNAKYGGPVITFSIGDGSSENPEGCAFHRQVDSNMSKAVSNGCIRMKLNDLMYIYRNCPVETRVVVY